MKPRWQLDITATTALNLTTIQTMTEAQLALESIFDRPLDWIASDINLQRALHVRFNNGISLENVWAWLLANLATLAGLGSGKFSRHQCPHDDLPNSWYSCLGDPAAAYQELTI